MPFMEMYPSCRLWRTWIEQLPMGTGTISPFFIVLRKTEAEKKCLHKAKLGLIPK